MNEHQCKAGMIVDCLGTRLGTLAGVRGGGEEPLLEVQPARHATDPTPLLIPTHYVAQVLDETVLLNVSCAEATRIGQDARRQEVGLETALAPPAPIGRAVEPVGEAMRVPMVEETLVPVTRWQEVGTVELRKTTHTVTQELDVPLRYEQATLERVPVNRVLAEGEVPAPRQEGDTLIMPVVHEEVVAVKRRMLVEEIRITKQIQATTRHIAESVQRDEIAITHTGLEAHPADLPPPAAGP